MGYWRRCGQRLATGQEVTMNGILNGGRSMVQWLGSVLGTADPARGTNATLDRVGTAVSAVPGGRSARLAISSLTRAEGTPLSISRRIIAGSPDRRIAGSPDRRIAGSPDRRIAGSPDRRIAGSPDRRIAGSPDRRIAGSPDRASCVFMVAPLKALRLPA